MAVGTIAGLTLKEAVRRRTLVGAFLMGLLVLGMSLLLMLARARMHNQVIIHRMTPDMFAFRYTIVRGIFLTLSLFLIKMLGSLFAILLAGGAISSEIERGLLAVILPKPIPRWQILLGKWIGLNIILTTSVLVWTILAWASFTYQTRAAGDGINYMPLLRAGPILALYPVLISTLALALSTFAQRLLGTSLALTLCCFAFFDGVFNAIARNADVDALVPIANVASLVVPQGTVAWWVEDTLGDLLFSGRKGFEGNSPRVLEAWGQSRLHLPHFDAVYIVVYIVVVLVAGMVVFQKRDV